MDASHTSCPEWFHAPASTMTLPRHLCWLAGGGWWLKRRASHGGAWDRVAQSHGLCSLGHISGVQWPTGRWKRQDSRAHWGHNLGGLMGLMVGGVGVGSCDTWVRTGLWDFLFEPNLILRPCCIVLERPVSWVGFFCKRKMLMVFHFWKRYIKLECTIFFGQRQRWSSGKDRDWKHHQNMLQETVLLKGNPTTQKYGHLENWWR